MLSPRGHGVTLWMRLPDARISLLATRASIGGDSVDAVPAPHAEGRQRVRPETSPRRRPSARRLASPMDTPGATWQRRDPTLFRGRCHAAAGLSGGCWIRTDFDRRQQATPMRLPRRRLGRQRRGHGWAPRSDKGQRDLHVKACNIGRLAQDGHDHAAGVKVGTARVGQLGRCHFGRRTQQTRWSMVEVCSTLRCSCSGVLPGLAAKRQLWRSVDRKSRSSISCQG
jgi:hypothetical protein